MIKAITIGNNTKYKNDLCFGCKVKVNNGRYKKSFVKFNFNFTKDEFLVSIKCNDRKVILPMKEVAFLLDTILNVANSSSASSVMVQIEDSSANDMDILINSRANLLMHEERLCVTISRKDGQEINFLLYEEEVADVLDVIDGLYSFLV